MDAESLPLATNAPSGGMIEAASTLGRKGVAHLPSSAAVPGGQDV